MSFSALRKISLVAILFRSLKNMRIENFCLGYFRCNRFWTCVFFEVGNRTPRKVQDGCDFNCSFVPFRLHAVIAAVSLLLQLFCKRNILSKMVIKKLSPQMLILVITESTTAHLSLRFCRRLKCKRCTLSHQFHRPNLLTQEIIDFILSSENFAITFTFRCKVEAIQFSVNEKTLYGK